MTFLRRTPIRRKSQVRPGWTMLRRLCESRASGWCEANTPACPGGLHRGSQAHHVRMRSQGGADELGNLLWVCAVAHSHIHLHPAESYERGWLRRTQVAS